MERNVTMNKHILRFGLLVVAILLCGGLLYAEDFTFNAPVELHNIPVDIKTFSVSVEVYDKEFSGGYPAANSTRIGYGNSPQIPIANGEYVGTITIKFNAVPGKKPEKAIVYDGWLGLFGPTGYQGGCLVAMGLDGPYPYDPQKPRVCEFYSRLPLPLKQLPDRPIHKVPQRLQ